MCSESLSCSGRPVCPVEVSVYRIEAEQGLVPLIRALDSLAAQLGAIADGAAVDLLRLAYKHYGQLRNVLRGTKTVEAARVVPIVAWGNPLLEHAERFAEGLDGALFRPWGSVRRDLAEACKRAKLAALSPNDLRRTYGTWLRMGGVEPHLIGVAMGHRDSRMVERVYGRMPHESLGKALRERVGDCRVCVATIRRNPAL